MSGKVFFKYGVMGASKSLDLIRAEFNYRERGLNTLVLTPRIDTRGKGRVKSRIGLSVDSLCIGADDSILSVYEEAKAELLNTDVHAVFVDEIHFFTEKQIDELTEIADTYGTSVICYGLRTDFRNKAFPASVRLFEVADEIDEIKAMCKCGNKATYTARFIEQTPVFTGSQVKVGDEEYKSFCRKCYKKLKLSAN